MPARQMSGMLISEAVGLTREHLQFCHPSVLILLTKLFQLIVRSGCIPSRFRGVRGVGGQMSDHQETDAKTWTRAYKRTGISLIEMEA